MSTRKLKLQKKIASGSYSDVYRILDTVTEKQYAMKTIKSRFAGYQVFHSIFRWNVEVSRRVTHPNILRNHFFIHESDRKYFLVMDYIDGFNLFQVSTLLGELPLQVKYYLFLAVIAGLNKCHQTQIVHRNLTSSNVLISRSGDVRIANFGLSAVEKPDPGDIKLSDRNIASLAPEQFHHLNVSEKTDIWALGIVMHELLLGKHPFLCNNPALTKNRICNEELNLPPALEPGLAVLLDRCLQKDPEKRFPSLSPLREEIQKLGKHVGFSSPQARSELAAALTQLTHETGKKTSSVKPIAFDTKRIVEESIQDELKPVIPPQDTKEIEDTTQTIFPVTDSPRDETSKKHYTVKPEIPEPRVRVTASDALDDGDTQETEETIPLNDDLHKPLITNADPDSLNKSPLLDDIKLLAHQKSDKPLFYIMLILAFVLVGLILTGDYFNVAKWPTDLLNSTRIPPEDSSKKTDQSKPVTKDTVNILASFPHMPTTVANTPANVFKGVPSPVLPTATRFIANTPTTVYTPTIRQVVTSTPKPPYETSSLIKAAVPFAKGDLNTAISLLKKQISATPGSRKDLNQYLKRLQSLQRSLNMAREDLQGNRFSSALVQLSVIEDAFKSLAKDMGAQLAPDSPVVIDGLDIDTTRKKIGDPVLFLLLPGSYGISKVYINGNPVQFKNYQRAYMAHSMVAVSGSCLIQISDRNGQLREARLSIENNLRGRNPEGIWLLNDHKDDISAVINGKQFLLRQGQRTFLVNPGYVTLNCGSWGNYTFDKSMLFPDNDKISRIHVIHVQ